MDINNNNTLPEGITSVFINSINEDNTINSLIDLFNRRHNELYRTIIKYDVLQVELQKELEIDELLTNSFIADVNLNHREQYNLQSYAKDIIDFIYMKTSKLKELIITESKEVEQQLNKFKEKKTQMKPVQMTFDETEMTFDLQIQPSVELTNSTIRNFIPDVNSTLTPVNDTYQNLSSANSLAVSSAPASPNNLQTNEVDEIGDMETEHENDKTNTTVVVNLKPAEPLKTTNNMNNKKFECKICKKFYSNQKSLSNHKRLYHSKQSSFECEICNKKFNILHNLRSHKKTHDTNRPKPFKCQQCDYATDSKANFSMHEKFHERQKKKFASMKNPIKCEKCPTFCKNKKALWNHMLKVHPKVLYQCDLCGIKMKTKTNLKMHILRHMKK